MKGGVKVPVPVPVTVPLGCPCNLRAEGQFPCQGLARPLLVGMTRTRQSPE